MEWLWIGYLSKESVLDTENCTFCFPKWNELRNGNLFLQTQRLKSNVNGSQRDGTSGCCKLLFAGKPCWNFMRHGTRSPDVTGPKLPCLSYLCVRFHQWWPCLQAVGSQLRSSSCATGVPQDRAEQLPLSKEPLWRHFMLLSLTADKKKWILWLFFLPQVLVRLLARAEEWFQKQSD